VNIALRDGLVEVPGALPTFASAGLEARAAMIGRSPPDGAEKLAVTLLHCETGWG